MYELKRAGEKSFGIYRAAETDVFLIGRGNDKEAGSTVHAYLSCRKDKGEVLPQLTDNNLL